MRYAEDEGRRRSALIAQAEQLALEGIEYIQLREKDLPASDLIGLTREILSAIRHSHSGTRLLINSRADVALASGADGVHLPSGEEQLTPAQIRRLFKSRGTEEPAVSVSCHTLDEVARAKKSGAGLILFGPVFGKSVSNTLVVPGTGIEALRPACSLAAGTPVLALGGVTAFNTAACIEAGARGIAGIRLFR